MTAREIAGDVLHYDDVPGPAGAPVLVWGHGFLLAASSYTDVVRELPQYRHVVPDLRGHGRSAGVSGDPTLARMADDVWALVSHLRLGRFVFVGHSMGNAVGVRLVSRHPEAVLAGISIAGVPVSGKLDDARAGVAGMVDLAGNTGALTAALAGLFVHEPPDSPIVHAVGQQASLVPAATVAEVVGTQFFLDEAAGLLPGLGQPWLFLVPGADAAEPPAYQVSQARLFDDARVVVLDGEGHMLPQERPALAAQAVRTFVDGLEC